MKKTIPHVSVLILLCVILCAMLPCGCGKKTSPSLCADRQRLMLDTTDNRTNNSDSLQKHLERYKNAGDKAKMMATYAELGHSYMISSRYIKAVDAHQSELKLAEELEDTLVIATALNDLGTNFRRMGLYYEGINYHSQAVQVSMSSKDRKMLKCRAIGHNGLGNVYMNIGNYLEADREFRAALEIETQLGSDLGMNVDNSNLGMNFAKRGMTDSAWVYFKRAYQHSKKCNSGTGLAYCHMNFGNLYQHSLQYDKAAIEYQKAMDYVDKEKDLWTWLQPCIAMAGLNVATSCNSQAMKFLQMASNTATKIGAKEYFPQIYELYSSYYRNAGDFKTAYLYHMKADSANNDLLNRSKFFEIESLQIDIARRQNEKKMAEAKTRLNNERNTKWLFAVGFIGLMFFSGLLWYVARMRLKTNRVQRELMNVRERFFTNITHEFRTPLTVILGEGENVQNAKHVDEMHIAGDMIVRQGKQLLLLVNQLLDIGKMKSEVATPDWHCIDVVHLMEKIVDNYQPLAKAKKVNMVYVHKEDKLMMDVDPDYLHKIMCNIITNAVKFSNAEGNVNITSQAVDDKLQIMVVDEGIGMAQNVLNHIFEPFYQAGTESKNIGTGVGLALVHLLVKVMKGDIKAVSAPGEGTAFTIFLPLRQEDVQSTPLADDGVSILTVDKSLTFDDADNAVSLTDGESSADTTARILIVEDNDDVAHYIGSQLPKNYCIYYASNGEEGLKKATELLPDVILTDLMMPEMDGMELCRRIRFGDDTCTIPIIMITAKTAQEDLEAGLKAGANAYLFKPFSGNELRIRLEWILSERQKLREKFMLAAKEVDDAKSGVHDEMSVEDKGLLSQFTGIIYDQMSDSEIDLDAVATKMCMGKRTLRRKIIELTGCSLVKFVSKIRLDYAEQLLLNNVELSIGEIALQSGFNDLSYFSRTFKQAYGVSPVQFREQRRK